MPWYWIALIVYGAIGFLLGLFIAFCGPDSFGEKFIVIIACTIIWGPVAIFGLIEWIFLSD